MSAVLLRFILLGAIILIAYRLLQRALGLPAPGARHDDGDSTQAMRRCAYCGVHVPEGESTQSRGHFFCCEAHRDAFLRENR